MAPVTVRVCKVSNEAIFSSDLYVISEQSFYSDHPLLGSIPRPWTSAKNRGLVPHLVTLRKGS